MSRTGGTRGGGRPAPWLAWQVHARAERDRRDRERRARHGDQLGRRVVGAQVRSWAAPEAHVVRGGTRQALQGLQPCRPPKVLGPSRKIFFSSKRKKKKKICQTALPFPL